MRKVIADAATRRNSITQGCASNSDQAGRLNHQAEAGGFRTKAEEHDANDLAIAQALQELMEEEEMAKLCAPSGGGGLAWDPENGLQFDSNPNSRTGSPGLDEGLSFPPTPSSSREGPRVNGRPLSRLLTEHQNSRPKSTFRPPSRLISEDESDYRDNLDKALPPSPPPASPSPPPPISTDPTKWACPTCTLLNPLEFLSCDACGLEQPPQPIPQHKRFGPGGGGTALPKPPPQSNLRGPAATPFEPAKGRIGWNCLNCGTFMENQWWTCSLCGEMKLES
jgi:hypothetical protein